MIPDGAAAGQDSGAALMPLKSAERKGEANFFGGLAPGGKT